MSKLRSGSPVISRTREGPSKPISIGNLLYYARGAEESLVRRPLEEVLALDSKNLGALGLLAYHALRAGQPLKVLASAEEFIPNLLQPDPEVTAATAMAAVVCAAALKETGEEQQADLLLMRALKAIEMPPNRGIMGRWYTRLQIYALQGKQEPALSLLREAVTKAWGLYPPRILETNPTLKSLHDDPDFVTLMAASRAEAARQLALVRALESPVAVK